MDGFDYRNYTISRPEGLPELKRKSFAFWPTPAEEDTVARVIIPQLVAVETHFLKEIRRSVFCGGSAGGCMVDHERNRPRWTGYLLVELKSHSRRQVIWHCTPHAVRSCPDLIDKGRSLFNARLVAGRDGKSERSPMVARLTHGHYGSDVPRRYVDLLRHLIETFSRANNEEMRALRESRTSHLTASARRGNPAADAQHLAESDQGEVPDLREQRSGGAEGEAQELRGAALVVPYVETGRPGIALAEGELLPEDAALTGKGVSPESKQPFRRPEGFSARKEVERIYGKL